jgi:hypothetical protein
MRSPPSQSHGLGHTQLSRGSCALVGLTLIVAGVVIGNALSHTTGALTGCA